MFVSYFILSLSISLAFSPNRLNLRCFIDKHFSLLLPSEQDLVVQDFAEFYFYCPKNSRLIQRNSCLQGLRLFRLKYKRLDSDFQDPSRIEQHFADKTEEEILTFLTQEKGGKSPKFNYTVFPNKVYKVILKGKNPTYEGYKKAIGGLPKNQRYLAMTLSLKLYDRKPVNSRQYSEQEGNAALFGYSLKDSTSEGHLIFDDAQFIEYKNLQHPGLTLTSKCFKLDKYGKLQHNEKVGFFPFLRNEVGEEEIQKHKKEAYKNYKIRNMLADNINGLTLTRNWSLKDCHIFMTSTEVDLEFEQKLQIGDNSVLTDKALKEEWDQYTSVDEFNRVTYGGITERYQRFFTNHFGDLDVIEGHDKISISPNFMNEAKAHHIIERKLEYLNINAEDRQREVENTKINESFNKNKILNEWIKLFRKYFMLEKVFVDQGLDSESMKIIRDFNKKNGKAIKSLHYLQGRVKNEE